jgi:hypothetical protein
MRNKDEISITFVTKKKECLNMKNVQKIIVKYLLKHNSIIINGIIYKAFYVA